MDNEKIEKLQQMIDESNHNRILWWRRCFNRESYSRLSKHGWFVSPDL